MLEEVLETINLGLGLDVTFKSETKVAGKLEMDDVEFVEGHAPCLVELADGLADCEVVQLGTAACAGIAHQPVFELVMGNNLLKFAPGHYFREDGKLVKPKDHPAITGRIELELGEQGNPWSEVK